MIRAGRARQCKSDVGIGHAKALVSITKWSLRQHKADLRQNTDWEPSSGKFSFRSHTIAFLRVRVVMFKYLFKAVTLFGHNGALSDRVLRRVPSRPCSMVPYFALFVQYFIHHKSRAVEVGLDKQRRISSSLPMIGYLCPLP